MQDTDVDKILERMGQLESKVDHVLEKIDTDAKNNTNKASKPVMALALGAAGAKIGGLIGAKAGWTTKLVQRSHEVGFEEALHESFLIPKDAINEQGHISFGNIFQTIKQQSKPVLIGSAIGAVVVGCAAASLGWHRGDRLEDAFDLVKHPIDSMNRLLISDKEFAEQYPAHVKQETKNWQHKIESSQEQQEQEISV